MKKIINVYWLVAVGAVVGLLLGARFPASRASAATGGGTFGATVAGPTSLLIGNSGTFTVNVTANNLTSWNDVVDVEVHDASNNKVYQQSFVNQSFVVGQIRPYSISWTPSAAGNYTVQVGLFTANWATVVSWQSSVLAISVAAQPNFSVTATANPNNFLINQTTNIILNATDGGGADANVMVDMEVDDASGHKVFQQFASAQSFSANSTKAYTFAWKPSAVGTYYVAVGVFGAHWSGPLMWNPNATTVTVTAPVVITTTPQITASGLLSVASPSKFYVDPNSDAAMQMVAWQSSDPTDATRMSMIASEPQATWFGDWNANVQSDVNNFVTAAQKTGTMPILVTYDIPDRDCGGYSSGGATSAAAYQSWIDSFAAGIGSRSALVILEPDALASMDCLSSTDQATRENLLSDAVSKLKSLGNTKVYLDAGNSNWISAVTMAPRLAAADISAADGFSLNVSNFYTTTSNVTFGTVLSALVGGKHFVIDTSRNGNGPTSDDQWCNPSGRALGIAPTTNTGNPLVDAYLWIKSPGESDGACNGGPSAGTWWPQYAAGLAQSAGY